MSYFTWQEQCVDCGYSWNTAFGIVGTTQIADPTRCCPECKSTRTIKIHDEAMTRPVKEGATISNPGVMRDPISTTSKCYVCGEKFTCYHSWSGNHCGKCGKGAGDDQCKGRCPECHKKHWKAVLLEMVDEMTKKGW